MPGRPISISPRLVASATTQRSTNPREPTNFGAIAEPRVPAHERHDRGGREPPAGRPRRVAVVRGEPRELVRVQVLRRRPLPLVVAHRAFSSTAAMSASTSERTIGSTSPHCAACARRRAVAPAEVVRRHRARRRRRPARTTGRPSRRWRPSGRRRTATTAVTPSDGNGLACRWKMPASYGLAALPAEVLEDADEGRRRRPCAVLKRVRSRSPRSPGSTSSTGPAELRERRDDLVVGEQLAPRGALVLGELERVHEADLAARA